MLNILSRFISWPTRAAQPLDVRELSFEQVRDRLAERLYRQSLLRGGGMAEIGLFGPELFRQDAVACLEDIALGQVQGGPPTP